MSGLLEGISGKGWRFFRLQSVNNYKYEVVLYRDHYKYEVALYKYHYKYEVVL